MKFSIIASILLVVLLSLGATKASAAPWRGGYGHGRGYYAPRPAVRVYGPQIVIGGGGCYGGHYGQTRYYARPSCAPRYYGRPHYYGGGYRHCR
ncbi:MAG: hypothetical protein JWQ38_327 [Flavipsychrobacter sp.]|nr:hypothetical protein [Flavipsychrobacter sp.]